MARQRPIVHSILGIAAGLLLVATGPAPALASDITIAVISDSTLYGSGLDPAQTTPGKLKEALRASGQPVDFVVAPSLPTTKGGVVWLKSNTARALFADPKHSAVILSLGTWDCETLNLQQTQANLDKILSGIAAAGVPVLLVATKARAICPADYGTAYPAIFPALAARYKDLLYVDPGDAPLGFTPLPVDNLLPSVISLLAALG